jgi:ribosomal protein S7
MSQNFYKKFIGLFIKKGKKNIISKIIYKIFIKLSKKFKLSFIFLMHNIFLTLNTFVESKSVKIKRRIFIVPFSINLKRRVYLSIKWIIISVLKKKTNSSLFEKLFNELVNIIIKKDSNSLNLKKENLLKALSNRSNAHFRW